jgi:hypothetical protein
MECSEGEFSMHPDFTMVLGNQRIFEQNIDFITRKI